MKNDLCIGCGICAGICPQNILKIQDNKYGEYIPFEISNCISGCGLCLEVCPFSNNENETQIGKKIYRSIEGASNQPETGYYLEAYAGYSSEFRQKSSSGGMATWLLTKLLREKIVDYVICPTPQKNPKKLFDFEILNDENDIKNASGSVYYPVELSQVIKKILEIPGRYVITGLPCFIKGLRLATQNNRKLKERIVFTIGLVCGQIKSKKYTEYIALLANDNNSEKIQHVYYRGKSPDKPASNFYYEFTYENGLQNRIFWEEGISEAWVNRWFTPNACNYCDDVFAELADIAFMDAWLPEYSTDSRGANLILVRLPEILALIQEGMEKEEINVRKISIEEVIKSQAGVLKLKRNQLSDRLYIAIQDGQKIPEKRVHRGEKIGILKKREIKLKARMQKESKEIFLDCCQNGTLDIKMFRDRIQPYTKRTKQLRLVGKFAHLIGWIKK